MEIRSDEQGAVWNKKHTSPFRLSPHLFSNCAASDALTDTSNCKSQCSVFTSIHLCLICPDILSVPAVILSLKHTVPPGILLFSVLHYSSLVCVATVCMNRTLVYVLHSKSILNWWQWWCHWVVLHYTEKCFLYCVHIYINEGRLNITPLYVTQ